MAGKKLSLIIAIDGTSKTVTDLRKIREELGGFDVPARTPGLDSLLGKVPRLAFAYNEVTSAIQNLLAQVRPVYDLLIGSNEQLNQQLLQSAGTITATSRVLQNGIEIKDPTEAIKALQPVLQQEIKKVELATQDLVGVTSQQTSSVFNTILTNVGLLNDQLQGLDGKGQAFNNSLEAASSLAPGLVATLGTLQLPIAQANDEINNLLKGDIDMTAQVAKTLGITREMVETWKAQGTLVAELNKRFEPFLKANALAARSVAGLTSNIQDIVEVTGRTAGAPLLTVLVDQLDQIFQFLKANQGQITETATDVVAVLAEVLKAAIASINQILAALAPSLDAIGQALGDAFGAGATTAQTTIENLTGVVVQAIEISTPFIQLLSVLTSGLADLAATPAGQTLVQLTLAAAGANLIFPKLASGIGSVFTAVNALESTFNNLIPLLGQTGAAKGALAAKEAALAIATGTTTAATNAQALAQARLTVGDYAGAAAATELAAAEQAKAVSMRQSALAIAGNIAKLGLLAGAVAAVGLAVNQFQDITKAAQDTQSGIENIEKALAKLDEARAAANAANAQGAQATQEAIAANVALIQSGLNPITQTLDGVIGFINQVTAQLNKLLQSPAALLIPGLRELKLALIATGQDGFPELSTAAEAAVSQSQQSFADLRTAIDRTFQEIGAGIKDKEGKLKFPNLASASKEELDAYSLAIEKSLAVLEASRPTLAADLKYKNENIKALKAAKEAIDAQAKSISIASPALKDQGTIYEALNKKIQESQRTLASSSDQPQVNAAAKTLADLTQQQFELGRITAEEAQQRLVDIAKNGKVEVETRQAAQAAIAKIQEGAADRRVAEFQRSQAEIDRLQAQGDITDAEAEKRRTASRRDELKTQLDDVKSQIAAEEEAIGQGRGSKTRLDQLKKQEGELATQAAQSRTAANKAALDLELQNLQQQLEDAEAATTRSAQDREISIQQQLNQGTISQREADEQRAQSNQQSLRDQLKAQKDYVADLQALEDPIDPDEKRAAEVKLRSEIQKTGQLQLQLLQAEFQAQEAVRQRALNALKDQREAIQDNLESAKAAAFALTQGIQDQERGLDRQKNAYSAISASLAQQSTLLQSRRGLQEALTNLAQTESQIRQEGLQEGLELTQRLKTEEDSRIRTVLQQRLRELGISGSEAQIQRQLAETQRREAQATLNRLAQKQQFDRTSLQLQLQQEEAQKRSALIEAQRNQLAAKRQVIEQKLAIANAVAAQQDAQVALEEAQLTQDPDERRRAIAAAQRQQQQADRDLLSAQQQFQISQEGVNLANQEVSQAQEILNAQDAIARNSQASLIAQQQAESAVAKQAADSAIFAANLAEAESRAKRIAESLGTGTAGVPQRRMGGEVESGQIYKVHQDEMFVSAKNGYMLRRSDALRVAREALGNNAISLGSVRSVAANSDTTQLLSALARIERSLTGNPGGISIQSLSQSITNQVPRDAGAIARMVEDANLRLISDLRNSVRRLNN